MYRICLLGDRLLAQRRIWNDTTEQVECHTRPGGPIYRMYCGNVTEEERTKGSDPDCAYMMSHNATLTPGIPGINLQTFKGPLYSFDVTSTLNLHFKHSTDSEISDFFNSRFVSFFTDKVNILSFTNIVLASRCGDNNWSQIIVDIQANDRWTVSSRAVSNQWYKTRTALTRRVSLYGLPAWAVICCGVLREPDL